MAVAVRETESGIPEPRLTITTPSPENQAEGCFFSIAQLVTRFPNLVESVCHRFRARYIARRDAQPYSAATTA